MEAVKYFDTKKRMLNSVGKNKEGCGGVLCDQCPFSSINSGMNISCAGLEIDYPEEAIAMVEKWISEHSQKTMLSDFSEKHPNESLAENSTPKYVYDCEECGFCKGERKMKNYEKYKDKVNNCDGEYFCRDFVKPIILKVDECDGLCFRCNLIQTMWLMGEYEEPEVDWSKVTVDTPILVRDNEKSEWTKRHFAHYENGIIYAWKDGRTSWTVYNTSSMTDWKYAKLAEREE